MKWKTPVIIEIAVGLEINPTPAPKSNKFRPADAGRSGDLFEMPERPIACTNSSTPADPGLLDNGDQRLLAGLARLQEGPEV